MDEQVDFNYIYNECLSWHDTNRGPVHEFFWLLTKDGAAYSPTLGIAVLWCVWKSGDDVVDCTFEVALNVTQKNLIEHVKGLGKWGDWDTWTTDILADFDHYSFYLNDEKDVIACVQVLAAICTAPDWTSEPKHLVRK